MAQTLLSEAQKNDIINTIMQLIADNGNEVNTDWKKEQAQKVLNLIEELNKLFRTNGKIKEDSMNSNLYQTYATKEGWADYVYYINRKTNYNRAFQIIGEILDILRNSNSIGIEIYKTEKDSKGKVINITKYTADREIDLPLSSNTSGNSVRYLLSQIQNQERMEDAFVQHYNSFAKIATKHYQKVVNTVTNEKTKKKTIYHNFNEGHIIEAYRRHLMWNGHKQNFTDSIKKKHVAIMLWYSLNSTGWWAGGDIGYTQIKGDNTKLATYRSIREVATIFLNIIRKPQKDLDIAKIKKLFSLHTLDSMVDPQNLVDKDISEFVDEVNKIFIRTKRT